jgi:hypothetical protein
MQKDEIGRACSTYEREEIKLRSEKLEVKRTLERP